LYLCFESLLYKFAANNRDKSIFCVPLSHAGYVRNLRELFNYSKTNRPYFSDIFKRWHKYTGFNLHPIQELGTIEFRHLSGTDDVSHISKWISLILALKETALVYKKEELFNIVAELNTNSEYFIFASNVLKDALQYLPNDIDFQSTMENDISHIKECFSPDPKLRIEKEAFEESIFYKRHKLGVIKKKEYTYSEYCIEDLIFMQKEEYTLYHKAFSEEQKEKHAKKYKELALAIVNKKKEQEIF